MLRKVLVRSALLPGVVLAKEKDNPPAKPEVKAEEGKKDSRDDCDPNKKLVRVSELPLYCSPPQCVSCVKETNEMDNVLTNTIKCVRLELQSIYKQAKVIKTELEGALDEAKEQGRSTIEFLREEENVLPRVGAIAVGGFSGFILAARKNWFKRLLYTGAGAGLIAALAYPQEARQYTELLARETKKNAIIGYHFINGISRDLTGYQLPALPIGHLNISDSHHPPPDAVPSTAHLLPPTVTPTHIPLPHEDPHEVRT